MLLLPLALPLPHSVPFHSLLPHLLQLGLQSQIATVAKFSLSYWMEEVGRTGSYNSDFQ